MWPTSLTAPGFGDLAPLRTSALVTLWCRSWSLIARGIRRYVQVRHGDLICSRPPIPGDSARHPEMLCMPSMILRPRHEIAHMPLGREDTAGWDQFISLLALDIDQAQIQFPGRRPHCTLEVPSGAARSVSPTRSYLSYAVKCVG
jgi:hypothetical protein